ncbi:hypothetical protein LTR36_009743 [Oleoguttula mirabilis]|uniref:alpha-amylase n=1 Tax=Oleoguttula mirabilis TaxID=1507867 RepID=A0AAV9J5B2_9PEZI|nr:hypothetical protein LTR36_009743 [Oleoguttula mirabilis]
MFSKSIITTAALSLALCQQAFAASAADWRSRSIYQVLTDRFARSDGSTTATCNTADRAYCGGSYVGIQNHLDYIQNMGFDAVWISPVTAQVQGSTADGYAYHGYWQQNLYELNSNFGTADDLKALSAALHARGMYLMVDVVVNHNGYNGAPSTVDYSVFNPFNDESYYHPYCSIDYSDTGNTTNIEQCWVGDTSVPLPDLRTEDADVAAGYQTWITQLVSDYSIDGLRIDTSMEVNTGFWAGFSAAAGVYMVGEVDEADATYVCSFQDYLPGVLNYGTYFPLVSAFSSTSGSISDLSDMVTTVKGSCADTSLLGTFSENHDQPRFASLTSDMALAQNVITFTLLADGIPIIYEGQEQHYNALGGNSDPYNREAVWLSDYNQEATLYELITTLNKIRKQAISDDSTYLTYQNYPIYTDTTTIAMRKGKMVTVLSNKGASGASYTQSIASGYASGTQVTELLACTTLTADSSGNLVVPMAAGAARVYYPTSSLSGSGLCGASTKKLRFMPRPKPKFVKKPKVKTMFKA